MDKRYCVHKITKGGLDNAVQVKAQLFGNLNVNISADTVRRALWDNGLGALPKVKKPEISKYKTRAEPWTSLTKARHNEPSFVSLELEPSFKKSSFEKGELLTSF